MFAVAGPGRLNRSRARFGHDERGRGSSSGGTPVKIALDVQTPPALRIHPDGRRVAFSTGTNAFEVWTLEKFLPPATIARK